MEDPNDIVLKLIEHKNQLKAVEKLVQRDPTNESLIALQKDLTNIISIGEKFIEARKKKSNAPPSDAAPREKKPTPREWGVYQSAWKTGERCQVLYSDRRWYIAEITDLDAQGTASLILLDTGAAHTAPSKKLRTYVPVLPESVRPGDDVRALWEFDGLFYEARVVRVEDDGRVKVLFAKYNHEDSVALEDIQPTTKKVQRDAKIEFHAENGTVKEKLELPEELMPSEKDSEFVATRKRKRIKNLRSEHKRLLAEEQRLLKQKSWRDFHDSMTNNKFLGRRFEKKKKSIFSTDLIAIKGPLDDLNVDSRRRDNRKYLKSKSDQNTKFI